MQRVTLPALLLLCVTAALTAQTELPWTQLSLSTCQVDAYRKANPDIDGRGIVIAILDTGVDMGVPGLQKTSTGEMKVIDVQDFSGEGDIDLTRALWNDTNDKIVRYGDTGSPELYTPPPADQRPEGTTLWFGVIKEKTYANSSVPDLNDNGKKDDLFGLCVISRDDGNDDDAVCYVDTNGNRDFSDEKPLRNYKLKYDTFSFAREKSEKQITPLTIALNIFVKKNKVVLHHDDGGHGTHVAGIAAGYRIMDQDGFNGVAPGAKIISMKIGENRLAGGSTTTGSMKSGFEYAAKFAREHNVTVVCNLSFGIVSIKEGAHDIDEFADKLLKANPGLIICTSAGNEGPGLSSVGTPGGAGAAITIAAMLAADTARDVMGIQIPNAQLAPFSSRGGELDKPDIATPGWSTSTVPHWNRSGDFWSGTSMSSPYATGLCAVLANQVRAKQNFAPRSDWIKAALMNTAEPVPGFNTIDYGAGKPNLVKAGQILDALVAKHRNDPLFAFKIKTNSPMSPEGTGRTAYWRSTWFPNDRPQAFTVTPVFAPQTDANVITAFSRRLTLRSSADWCKPQQEQIYFRDVQPANVNVVYDPAKLTEPGLYTATIEGLDGGEVALRLVNTIIVPFQAKLENDYRVKIDGQTVQGFAAKHYFVAVPTGASAMHITMRALEGKPSTARVNYIYRPNGLQLARGQLRLDTKNDIREGSYTLSKELEPGIWELPVTSARADEESAFSIEIRFEGVHAEPEMLADLSAKPGGTPSGEATLLNLFNRPVTVDLTGKIEGYRKSDKKKLKPDDDKKKISLDFTPEIHAARVRVEISEDDYAKFTDIPISAYDSAGKAIAQGSLEGIETTITVENPEPDAESASASLEIRPAFTYPDSDESAEFNVKIDYLYKDPVDIEVKRGETAQTTLYPAIPTVLSWSLKKMPPETPEGAATVGYLRATEKTTKQMVAEIEIVEKK
jgi:subtilisin family serine protease